MRRKASRQAPARAVAAASARLVGHAAVLAADRERTLEPVVDLRRSVDSKPSTSTACEPSPAPALARLELVEQPAVRGLQAGLRDRAHGLGAVQEAVEAHGAPGAVLGPRLHAHPRLA